MIRLTSLTASSIVAASAISLANLAPAQCTVLVRDSFHLGERPHGNNGRLRDAQVHDTLKDYWPQTPAGAMWIASDLSGVPTWAFAASSDDPAEVDPLDQFNGTAFGEAPACAVLPFTAPATPFTIAADVVQLQGSTSATYLGLTSNPALLSNFETFGVLWISLNGRGDWAVRANGSQLVAAGNFPLSGQLISGWLRLELTYDPATSMVSGSVMGNPIAPAHVALTLPILYLGMEAHESWNVVNNLAVTAGTPISVTITPSAKACPGGTASLTAVSNADSPNRFFWTRDTTVLVDGVQPSGCTISGASTPTITISNAQPADAGQYRCIVAATCGVSSSNASPLVICRADIDCSGSLGVQDIFNFLAAWFAGAPAGDFNSVGGITVQDIFDFLTAWFQGC